MGGDRSLRRYGDGRTASQGWPLGGAAARTGRPRNLPASDNWPRYPPDSLGPSEGRRTSAARTQGEMALTDPATLSPAQPSDPRAPGDALALSAAVICLNEAACIGKC